ncbi:MAG: P-loop NTPase fold protein [Coriobacteriia bacterium]|nr:P-loop NTPase fold protein [Coriobacteriia bacterium]
MSNESETLQKTKSLADVATDEDKLFHDGYVNGIAGFIKGCATPMTIAIQGDWGTGKTSLTKLVEAKLRSEDESAECENPHAGKYDKDIIGVATVDVWQHYSVNPNADLLDALLNEMISKLSGIDLAAVKGVSEFAIAVSQLIALDDDSAGAQDKSLFDSILSWLAGPGDEKKTKQPQQETVSADDVREFQDSFIDTLEKLAEKNGKSETSRFVVFVDGLDHIKSEAAVTLMEQIKTYLDCPRCVFVLSVDEKTVFDGVTKKLGDDVDEARKKLIFDKLVQVPFRIPSSAYNLDKYVKDLMEGREGLSGDFAAVIDILLKNPTLRCIKRCLNTMYLYLSVFGGMDNIEDDSLVMLLAAVILQVESPQSIDAIARRAEECSDENLDATLESLEFDNRINWSMLPALWKDKESGAVNAEKRDMFLSWIRDLA